MNDLDHIKLGQVAWRISALIDLIEAVIQRNTTFQDYEVICEFRVISLKKM